MCNPCNINAYNAQCKHHDGRAQDPLITDVRFRERVVNGRRILTLHLEAAQDEA
jgi:hypothetical protein